ncbi:MAG: hypothetical protein ABSB19_11800 [Methylomonas sp.]|jgi:hypothetical protein
MSEIIYVLTVLFFAYAINKVIGKEIVVFIKTFFPQCGLILLALQKLSTTSLNRVGVYFNRY